MSLATTIILISSILSAFLAIILFCVNLKNIKRIFSNSTNNKNDNLKDKKSK